MKKFFVGLLAAVGLLLMAAPAHADHNRWLPSMPTVIQLRVLSRGYGIYCLNKQADSFPGFRKQAQDVYEDEFEEIGIRWVESTNGRDCDVQHVMVPSNQFDAPGAAAYINYWEDPVQVFYNRDLMYSDWKTTIGHEWGHWDGSHERYRDSGGAIVCTGNTYTRNDCKSGVWWVTAYDRDVAWNTLVPDVPLGRNFSTADNRWMTLTWDNNREDCRGLNLRWSGTNFQVNNRPAHFSCKNDVATQMAFGYKDPQDDHVHWVGEWCSEDYNYCTSDYGAFYRSFDPWWYQPGRCFYIHAENRALWWVPQVSAPDYWTEVGCT